MCGIAGFANLTTKDIPELSILERMLDALHHRGPDDRGTATFPGVALGNTRLSIIDLVGGHQPIFNEDNSVAVVFNGEIYNHPELRDELLSAGHIFRTNSDTEMLVHLFEEFGPEGFSRLNGMYSFALYDSRKSEFFLVRDRFGVKPLYYSFDNEVLSFASEIKALRCLPKFSSALDHEGLAVFLGLFYICEPWTIYKSIKKLRAGSYLLLNQHGIKEYRYYDVDFSKKTKISYVEAEIEIARLIKQAVSRQLLSDVPVAVLLSGGLDSRTILACANIVAPHHTAFTISFEESLYNEGNIASSWSKLFDSRHSHFQYNCANFAQQLVHRQNHLDEPYALWCNVATAALAKQIHSSGFKVVLSGDGGDELFLGYPTIHAAELARFYRLVPTPIRDKIINPLIQKLPAGRGKLPLSFQAKSFFDAVDADKFRTFYSFKEVIRKKYWRQTLTSEAYATLRDIDPYIAHRQYLHELDGLNYIDALSYLDFKVFLPACGFAGADNAYMENSVELRVPFLDNDLVDFVSKLPTSIRFHPFKLKPLLRDSFENRIIPEKILRVSKQQKYKKQGFEIPVAEWLKQPRVSQLLSNILSDKKIEAAGFFQPKAVRRILEEQASGRQNNERSIQAIVSLSLFLENNQ